MEIVKGNSFMGGRFNRQRLLSIQIISLWFGMGIMIPEKMWLQEFTFTG
jgi:hypothetical protein